MNRTEISNLRLQNQQLFHSNFDKPDELVEWMGAIQAQDLPMSLLAIAVRTKNATVKSIENAFNEGKLIRTHLMRPTWHIVSHRDIYWMLDLTTAQIKRTIGGRHNELELSKEILSKANRLLEKNLENQELSRDEIKAIFHENKLRTNENRLSHLLVNAEMEQLICNGKIKGRLQTYALLSEKVPTKITLPREEAVMKLARNFFRSHGPATTADFVWWSGLPMKDTRLAMEEIKREATTISFDGNDYFFYENERRPRPKSSGTLLLPSYDEFLISYQSKHISINPEHRTKAATMNGIFKPIIVSNGEIIGTWKRAKIKSETVVILEFFDAQHVKLKEEIRTLERFFR